MTRIERSAIERQRQSRVADNACRMSLRLRRHPPLNCMCMTASKSGKPARHWRLQRSGRHRAGASPTCRYGRKASLAWRSLRWGLCLTNTVLLTIDAHQLRYRKSRGTPWPGWRLMGAGWLLAALVISGFSVHPVVMAVLIALTSVCDFSLQLAATFARVALYAALLMTVLGPWSQQWRGPPAELAMLVAALGCLGYACARSLWPPAVGVRQKPADDRLFVLISLTVLVPWGMPGHAVGVQGAP